VSANLCVEFKREAEAISDSRGAAFRIPQFIFGIQLRNLASRRKGKLQWLPFAM